MDATPFDITVKEILATNDECMIYTMHRGRYFPPTVRSFRGREYVRTSVGNYSVIIRLPLKLKRASTKHLFRK